MRAAIANFRCSDDPGRGLTVEQLINYCMKNWPEASRHGRPCTADAWCAELIELLACWTDLAFVLLCADRFGVAIALTGVDDRGNIFPMGLLMPLRAEPPQAWLELGCWVNQHFVAIAHVHSSAMASAGGAGGDDADEDAAMLEWLSFSWPLRTPEEVARLLECHHIRPTVLIGCEFSVALRSWLESRGVRALTVDRRESDAGGMHYLGDVQDVGHLTRWRAAAFFPPCFQQLRDDEDCLAYNSSSMMAERFGASPSFGGAFAPPTPQLSSSSSPTI